MPSVRIERVSPAKAQRRKGKPPLKMILCAFAPLREKFLIGIVRQYPHNIMEQTAEPRTRLRTIVVFSALFAILGAVVVFAYFSTFTRPVTTVILVRHAEKKIEPTNPDPDLAPEGVERAQEIARVFGEAGINAIYATQYKRTQQTVKPLSDRTGVPVTLLDANQSNELLKRIQTTYRGQTVFIAGHNNTVPAMVSELSG